MAQEIINVTDITEYLFCPRKVYLRLVKKVRFPPNQAMIKGQLKHRVFDTFNKNEPVIVSSIESVLSEREIINLYKTELLKIIQEIQVVNSNQFLMFKIDKREFSDSINKLIGKEINLRAGSVLQTLKKGFLGKELWRNLAPKYLSEFKIISENIGLRGKIDRVKFESSITPYEIKTRAGIYDSDKIQLAAYALLLEEEFNKKIEKGFIEHLEGSEEILLTEELKNKVLEIADKIRKMKDSPEMPSNFNKCNSCFFKNKCFE
ncbi:MAG: CRISPR-associated protein Cas4 [archaeon]